MDEYRKYEPIFGSWKLERLIGKGSFGKVFEISREEYGTTYRAALKVISVPQDEDDVKARMAGGTDIDTISEYYESILKEIVNENEIMSKLKGNSNIVSYEDHQIIPHEDGIGYDVLIRMELLTPLLDRMMKKSLEEKEVVKLGIDICKALELCHRKNIIHRDIKPQNIFISENGDFKLGDFGIARTMEKTTGGMSKKGTYKYMAPEVFRGENYDSTVDIYSLGIVIYSLLNGNRGPFLPAPPTKVTHADEEEARMRRFRGEEIPAPKYAGTMLTYIIKKACAANPAERYKTAEQMRRDLESYLANYGNMSEGSQSETTLPSYNSEETALSEDTPVEGYVPPADGYGVPRSTGMYNMSAAQAYAQPREMPNQYQPVVAQPQKKSKAWIAIVAVVAVAIVGVGIAAAMGLFSLGGSNANEIDLAYMMEDPVVSGYDGYGTLDYDLGVDEEKKKEILDGISDESKRKAVEDFLYSVYYYCDDDGHLCNGDKVTIYADYDYEAAERAGITVTGSTKDFTVSGLSDEPVEPEEINGFIIGEEYTVVAKEGVAVRSTPERLEKRANQIMYDDLSDQYKSQALGKSGDHAALKKGAKVVCLDIEGDWMRISDGWICTYFDGEELIR